MSSFINALLLDKVAFGFSCEREWLTTRVPIFGGKVARNSEWSRPKHHYIAPYENLDAEKRAIVVNAFNGVRGSAKAFRFFDRSDFTLDDQIIGTADGTSGQQIQLIKTYGFDGFPGEEETRIITKPVDSTVDYGRGVRVLGAAPAYIITANDVPISFTLDYLTGIVTLTATLGQIIRATGWFDVPVYFEYDRLAFAISNRSPGGYVGSANVELTEDWFV